MKPFKFKWILPSEKEIQNSVLEYLNHQPGCFAFQVNTMGVYDQRGGFYRKPGKWVMKGTCDVILVVDGKMCAIECKSATGKQSKDQKLFEERLKTKAQGMYFVVRSIQDAMDALEEVKKNPK